MLSPLQQLHSLAFTAACENMPTDPVNASSHMFMQSESILVPAFSCDGYTAGYMVEDLKGSEGLARSFCISGCAFAPLVMSETDGSIIGSLQKCVEPNTTAVTLHQRNCRVVSFTTFSFNKSALSALTSARINSLLAYECAIKSVIYAEGIRDCSMCGVNRTEMCSCVFTMRRARNSLDFSTYRRYFISQMGDYRGIGFHEVFENGRSVSVANLSASNRFSRIARQGCAPRLFKWAISRALLAQPARITRVLHQPFESENTLDDEAPIELLTAAQSLSSPSLFSHFPSDISSEPTSSELYQSTQVSAELDLSVFPSRCTQHSEPAPALTDESVCAQGNPWHPLSMLPNVPATNCDEHLQMPSDSVFPPVSSTISAHRHISKTSRHANAFSSLTPAATLVPVPAASAISPEPAAPVTFGALLPIVPGPVDPHGLQPAATKVAREEEMLKNSEEIRKWKAYQRKIRNRESAARSNQARKQRRLALAKKQQQQEAGTVNFGSAVA